MRAKVKFGPISSRMCGHFVQGRPLGTKRPLEEMALYPYTINTYVVYEP